MQLDTITELLQIPGFKEQQQGHPLFNRHIQKEKVN